DKLVTGVQTCAPPICRATAGWPARADPGGARRRTSRAPLPPGSAARGGALPDPTAWLRVVEVGRGARGRVAAAREGDRACGPAARARRHPDVPAVLAH